MTIIRTARRHGATIATRVSVDQLIKDGKRVIGAQVIDQVTGKKIKVSAKSVVMCAGIWSDEMHEKFGITPGYGVTMSKGVHIVMPGKAIKSNTGIILKTEISVLFLIPWGNQWIVGTTDTPYDGDRANPHATSEDVQYILDQANKVLDPKLKREEIIGVYAGLRPLVANKKGSATTKLSREHTTDRSAPGFVSIAGGKYTTYRVMGKDAIDLAATDLRKVVSPSCTEKLPLVGTDGYYGLVQQSAQIAAEYGLDEKTVIHLLNRYGSLISEVLQLIVDDKKLAKPLSDGLPYLRAEILYAATHEGATSVDDVISRRTRLAFEAPNAGIDLAEEIATIIAPVLGWGAREKKASVAEYRAEVDAEVEALHALVKA
jgi:glycerol-3-phosphate dehydrogenase